MHGSLNRVQLRALEDDAALRHRRPVPARSGCCLSHLNRQFSGGGCIAHLLYAGVVQEEEQQQTFYIDVDVPGIIVNMSKIKNGL